VDALVRALQTGVQPPMERSVAPSSFPTIEELAAARTAKARAQKA